jgi:hypothetical protein
MRAVDIGLLLKTKVSLSDKSRLIPADLTKLVARWWYIFSLFPSDMQMRCESMRHPFDIKIFCR